MLTLDAFIDLTQSGDSTAALRGAIERWHQLEQLAGGSGLVSVAMPADFETDDGPAAKPGWRVCPTDRAATVLESAFQAAADRGAWLVVLIGPLEVGSDALGMLHEKARVDPMFGFAIPRVSCRDGCCIAALTKHGVGPVEWIPRKVLADLPESEILVETLSPCILVAPAVVAGFTPASASGLSTLDATLLHLMASARRCGFRTVICNRAVVGRADLECTRDVAPIASIPPDDLARLIETVPELDRCWEEFRAASWQRFEHICAGVPHDAGQGAGQRPSLLFDVRNVGPMFNGTTHAVLSVVGAFRELARDWDMALLASPGGAAFHDYRHAFSGWPVYTTRPERTFTVAFRPSQPWHVQELADLHRLALINAYMVLDTISWDIGYSAPPQLDGVWQLLAESANGLLYDSEFTRQRFLERFPAGRTVPGMVTRFSFDPSDYRSAERRPSTDGPFALVVGNHLDHKDVRQTVDTLSAAFPYQPITALGPANVSSPLVTAKQSGQMPEGDIQDLYASAKYVVYPSFYEGFGFPVINALAYGKTVLARRSALLEELAGDWNGGGRLIAFDRREELVELLGRLTHGEAVPEIPLGGVRDGSPTRTWHHVAADTHAFLKTLVTDSARRQWIARERVLSLLTAARG